MLQRVRRVSCQLRLRFELGIPAVSTAGVRYSEIAAAPRGLAKPLRVGQIAEGAALGTDTFKLVALGSGALGVKEAYPEACHCLLKFAQR